MSDPSAARQLLSGFYGIENRNSRWTAKEFAFALKPPSSASRRGATLRIHLYLPETEIDELGPMTLSTTIDGYHPDPETFSEPGLHVYSAPLPAALADTNILPVHCSFDKAMAPTAKDSRELGAVITQVELE